MAQIPMGQLTPKLLDILNIKNFIIDSLEKVSEIGKAVDFNKKSNNSVGILLKRQLWRE
jgi:sulfopyruvate decarboxylase TPP-binding subunit